MEFTIFAKTKNVMTEAQIKKRIETIKATFSAAQIGQIVDKTAFSPATIYNYIGGSGGKKSTKISIINAANEIENENKK